MKTVGELIHSLNKADVLAELVRLYHGYDGEDPDGYDEMWDILHVLQPKLTDMSVMLSSVMSEDDQPKMLVDVSGVMAGDNQHYAIEFRDWAEWLSMPVILAEIGMAMTDAEKLARCLYEMSWCGYTYGAAHERYKDIADLAEEAKNWKPAIN